MLKKVEKLYTYAHLTDEITTLEKENRALAREIAKEAIVLLKNDNVLPLKNKHIALYGDGATHTIKGGSGSGEVNERKSISIYEGLLNYGFKIENKEDVDEYIKDANLARKEYEKEKVKEAGFFSFKVINMSNIEAGYHNLAYFDLTNRRIPNTDTAIYVISRMSGEGGDRKKIPGDFYLSKIEESNIRFCVKNYKNFILVINSGSMVDLSSLDDIHIPAIFYIGMLGEEGGNAFASILSGDSSPSGHLADTWPIHYEDIPFGNEFSDLNGDMKEEYYKEDIYVGYRYYERFQKKVRFPFGYGLSYTSFQVSAFISYLKEIILTIHVKNIGDYKGKYVGQVYVSKPDGKLYTPESELFGFSKTKELYPNEEDTIEIKIPYSYFKSFDEDIEAYIIEKGNYILYLGENVLSKQEIGGLHVHEDILFDKVTRISQSKKDYEKLIPKNKKIHEDKKEYYKLTKEMVLPFKNTSSNPMDDLYDKAKEIVNKLSYKELAYTLTGCGNADIVIPGAHDIIVPGAAGNMTSKLNSYGIKNFACCDGPAGLRLLRTSVVHKNQNKIKVVEPGMDMFHFLPGFIRMLANSKKEKGTPLYCYATAFPTGSALAQTWNQDLIQRMGDAVGKEMEEYGVTLWLAPGMNIHRNPLCGRNYEYYSEDPILSGKMAAAIIKGVQSHIGCYASIKHFFCNNQENNRKYMSANVSERAMREIYLKGFEIAVCEADARALMASYNRINGIWSAVLENALTKLLREEWGFKGIVVTDWDGSHKDLEAERAIQAGINFLMPGDFKQRKAIRKALKNGSLDLNQARELAVRNLEIMLLHSELIDKEK